MTGSSRVDFFASFPHFVDHLLPVWRSLPRDRRGVFYGRTLAVRRAASLGVKISRRLPPRDKRLTVVASFGDVATIPNRPFVMIEHGAGQSYGMPGGVPPDDARSALDHLCRMEAICVPNEPCASRNRVHHAHSIVEVTGTPKLDDWFTGRRKREPDEPPLVVFAWHWPSRLCPETWWAFPYWRDAVAQLAASSGLPYRLAGHGHPKAWPTLAGWYARHGIEPIGDWSEALRRASVVVFDNTSFGWEAAAVGVPVVVLDAPWFRRDVDHGLRFWQHANAGVRVSTGLAVDLDDAIRTTLAADPAAPARALAVDEVFPLRDGGASDRACALITDLANKCS